MTITLRIILVLASVLCFILVIRKIKQSKLKVEDSILWILGALLLIFMCIFSDVVEWIALKLGFMSTVNFVFVIVSFFLLIISFKYCIKMSVLNEKIKNLNHYIALKEYEEREDKDEL